MKRTTILCISIAMIILGSAAMVRAASSDPPERRGPRIEVKEDHVDLGPVKEGVVAEHEFELRNAGDEVLVIQRVQTS